jgi:hypothetical protein
MCQKPRGRKSSLKILGAGLKAGKKKAIQRLFLELAMPTDFFLRIESMMALAKIDSGDGGFEVWKS